LLSDRVNLKTVWLFLSLCQAGSAAALGMGDIAVHSHWAAP